MQTAGGRQGLKCRMPVKTIARAFALPGDDNFFIADGRVDDGWDPSGKGPRSYARVQPLERD
jgi:hypothetical protein